MDNTAINTSVENQDVDTTTTTGNEEVKTFTADEVQVMIDRAVQQGVATNKKRMEKEFAKQLSLSKLDGEERAKAEKDNRIAELEQQLAEFQIERNRSELKSVLSARGLSAEFADIIDITDDIEASQAKIDKLDKLIKTAVKETVEKRLAAAGGSPKGNGSSTNELTEEAIKKMSMAELNELADKNPELFNKYFNK